MTDPLADYVPTAPSWRSKGLPARRATSPAAIAPMGQNLFDDRFLLPTMVLLGGALDHNVELLAGYFRDRGVSYAPHGKTTMSPQIWRLQLAAGAWAITVATPWQASVAATVGVPRVFIANEVVDAGGLAWLRGALDGNGPELIAQVDSGTGVELMARGLAGSARRLPVLLDIGQVGGRTGVRSVEDALSVARAVADAEPLRLSGLTFFEGASPGATPDEQRGNVHRLLRLVREIAGLLDADIRRDGAPELLLSGGGSRYFDLVVDELTKPLDVGLPVRVVVRSGAAITHDHGLYAATSPLRAATGGLPALWPAIEVWAPVISIPEEGLAIIGAGRRDLPYDEGLPTVIKHRDPDGAIRQAAGAEVSRLNDQHAFVALAPDAQWRVGDLVGLGISHPCSAFDRWRWVPVVDDAYDIVDVFDTIF